MLSLMYELSVQVYLVIAMYQTYPLFISLWLSHACYDPLEGLSCCTFMTITVHGHSLYGNDIVLLV